MHISICVPTPLRKTKDPDLSYIVAAVEEVSEYLRAGQLIVLESTTYPGTTRRGRPSDARRGGLVAGRDFFPRLLAGAGRPRQRRVAHGQHAEGRRGRGSGLHGGGALYEQIVSTIVPVSSTSVAEMVKLLSRNTFRAVNIGMVTSWRSCAGT
jgi:UDP-N-acetyl-D-glucosamine dehydrogenase